MNIRRSVKHANGFTLFELLIAYCVLTALSGTYVAVQLAAISDPFQRTLNYGIATILGLALSAGCMVFQWYLVFKVGNAVFKADSPLPERTRNALGFGMMAGLLILSIVWLNAGMLLMRLALYWTRW